MQATRSRSEAQRSLGLSDDCYSKFLHITLEVAKNLVKQLSHKSPLQTQNFTWGNVSLFDQRAALLRVREQLLEEGIDPIEDEKVRERLKKAMATYQRVTKKTVSGPAAAVSVAPSSTASDAARPYDPIRDL